MSFTPPPVAPVGPPPSGNEKIWSMLSHLSAWLGVPFLLPWVVWLAMRRESDYVSSNAREALNFHISMLIYAIVCVPLAFIVIGIPLLVVLAICYFVFAIVAAAKASDGGCYHYPLTMRLVK